MKLGKWAVVVLVIAVVIVMAPSDNNDGVSNSARKHSASDSGNSSGAGVGHVDLELLAKLKNKHKEKGQVSNAFNPTSWYVAPPAKRKVIAPPPTPLPPPVVVPTAPAMPFTYLGRYGDSDSRKIVLSNGDRVYVVSLGETIDNTYRVEKYSPGKVILTYLPMNVEQSLSTGE